MLQLSGVCVLLANPISKSFLDYKYKNIKKYSKHMFSGLQNMYYESKANRNILSP